MYCDPPYYLGDGSLVSKGLYPRRGYPIHHVGFNHLLLRDLIYEQDGGVVLSYNDCDTIRSWYSDFRIVEIQWRYTLGLGKNGAIKPSNELLIMNY